MLQHKLQVPVGALAREGEAAVLLVQPQQRLQHLWEGVDETLMRQVYDRSRRSRAHLGHLQAWCQGKKP